MKKRFLKIALLITFALCSVFVVTACGVEFKVDFIVDGEVYASVNTNGAETIKMPADPEKDGYEFDGWYWDKETWAKPFTANSLLDAPLSNNMQVYAKWTTIENKQAAEEGKIIFKTLTVVGDKAYTKVGNDTKTFSFINEIECVGDVKYIVSSDIGGSQKIDTKTLSLSVGDNKVYVTSYSGDEPKSVYEVVIRRRPMYTINFRTNGGTAVGNQSVEEDSFATAPVTTKKGYTFASWDYDFSKLIVKDMTINAEWTANKYYVTFNKNGGNGGTDLLSTTYDSTMPALTAPVREGYAFTGYYDAVSGGSKYYNDDLTSAKSWDKAENATLYARWEVVTYGVTYELNGGVNSALNPTTYTVEDNIDLQASAKASKTVIDQSPLSDGSYSVKESVTEYTFAGWYSDGDFTNRVTVLSGVGDMVLYAKWIESTSTTTSVKAYKKDGNYIYFGSYPQTKVTDSSLIASLNNLTGTLPTSGNTQNWTSYGYYISGNVSDYMWYIDIEQGGAKYRGVYFTSYRPYLCDSNSSSSNGYQCTNGYYTSEAYWFKYEPIKWQILEEADGYATILADIALDSQQYYHSSSYRSIDGKTIYANNYAESEIRAWLNDTFYNTAFSDLQKSVIETVTVDNSAASTGYDSNFYACADTNDKIWLLSYKEAFNKYFNSNSARQKKSSDYAKSQGCRASTSWWLRSPYYYYSHDVRSVDDDGDYDNLCGVGSTDSGVVPALKIKLS